MRHACSVPSTFWNRCMLKTQFEPTIPPRTTYPDKQSSHTPSPLRLISCSPRPMRPSTRAAYFCPFPLVSKEFLWESELRQTRAAPRLLGLHPACTTRVADPREPRTCHLSTHLSYLQSVAVADQIARAVGRTESETDQDSETPRTPRCGGQLRLVRRYHSAALRARVRADCDCTLARVVQDIPARRRA